MNDEERTSALRCMSVWLLATLATATTWWLVVPAAASLTSATGWSGTFDTLLVRVCAAALLPSTGWLWAVATSTVTGVLRGRPRASSATRRLVLVACGVAVVAGVAAPATASGHGVAGGETDARATHPSHSIIAGLSLPDRATSRARPPHDQKRARPIGPTRRSAASPASEEHVVVPGDSLWSIAAAHVSEEPIEPRWRAIWRANRDVIGDDPDLILPGQRLALPTNAQDHATTEGATAPQDNRRAR